MNGLLLEVKSLWLLGMGDGLGNLHGSEKQGVLDPPSPAKWRKHLPVDFLGAEVRPQVAAGPASSPTSVAEAAGSASRC